MQNLVFAIRFLQDKVKAAPRLVLEAALISSLASCGGGGNGQSGGGTATTPPAETTQQFVADAMTGQGSTDLVNAAEQVTFKGCLSKAKTQDPRTLGAANFLTNLTQSDYRLVSFSYVMDTSGIQSGESVESDIGFTVLPKDETVALNSGQELMITHRYDVQPVDRGISSVAIPQGGLVVGVNQRLSIASVSAIFPLDGSGAEQIDDARLNNGALFRVCYSATLSRADKVASSPILSYRSPFRDRSYVADPARTTAPFTSFKNTSSHVVNIYDIGAFISNLSSTEPSTEGVDVYVNGKSATHLTLPDHVPGQNSADMPMVYPVSIALAPGDILTVEGKIKPKRAIVFDFAAFIWGDAGLTNINEKLDILPIDLNGDGYKDIIDLDSSGSLWVSLRVGQGLQNTEQEWARALTTLDTLSQDTSVSSGISLKASNAAGLCLNLAADPTNDRFILEYCTNNSGIKSDASDVWGDYNGDGFIDRLRVDAPAKAYRVALGSASGLGPETIWAGGYGSVDKMFVSDANSDGKSDVMAEYSDAAGLECRIFYGGSTSFDPEPCPK